MSAHWIDITDDSLARHYKEAVRRNLDYRLTDDDNLIEVSSYSRRGLWHQVQLLGDKARCSCEATSPCSHLALALSHWFPVSCWQKWMNDESDAAIMFRYRVTSGATLSPSEKRRLTKAMRLVQTPPREVVESAGVPF